MVYVVENYYLASFGLYPSSGEVVPVHEFTRPAVCLFQRCSFCHIQRGCYRRTVPSVENPFLVSFSRVKIVKCDLI
jgi:hypothetical protein